MAYAVMPPRIERAAKSVAQNVMLQTVARAGMALAIPAVIWLASEILSLEKRQAAAEATQSQISNRLESIEAATRAGAASDSQAVASVAVLQAGQQHTLQMLNTITENLRRVERRLDDMLARQAALPSHGAQ